ncbi:MAG: lyase family protein [Pseudomonadota bacterium]
MTLAPGTPWTRDLLGDAEIEALFAEAPQTALLRRIEIAFLEAQGEVGVLSADAVATACAAIADASLNPDALRDGTARDGVVVPALAAALGAQTEIAHAGLTSQDVIDAAAILTAREVDRILATRLHAVADLIDGLSVRFGDRAMGGRTRMQLANPIRVADRLRTWRDPLDRQAARLAQVSSDLAEWGGGGADGTGLRVERAAAVSAAMTRRLGLEPGPPRHSERDGWAAYGACLAGVAGSAGKIGLDLTLMAQQGVDDALLSGGGASSAMPHKVNPVAAETAVALARHAATLSAGMQHALLHEQERSGTAWMLEWMALPQLQIAAGAALRHVVVALGDVEQLGQES